MSEKQFYFIKTPFPWVVVISFGMGLLGLLEYRPEVVNHESLWFLGKLTKFLAEEYPAVITAIWYPALAAHVGEAIYAFILARQKNLSNACCYCWLLQTLCFGFASLYYLKQYDPTSNQKKNE